MLRIYIDDSGTHADAPVVVVGGLLGNDLQWNTFDQEWRKLLAKPLPNKPPLKKFGLAECAAAQGEFISYSIAERDLVTRLFREVIMGSGVIGYASAIDRKAWNQLVVGRLREHMGDAENFCVTGCVREMLAGASQFFSDDTVEIVYDLGRENIVGHLRDFDFGRYINGPKVSSFTFKAVSQTAPLQGADMIATESYWDAKRWLTNSGEPPRPHLLHYLETAKGNGKIMTRAGIEEEIASRNPDGTVKSHVIDNLDSEDRSRRG